MSSVWILIVSKTSCLSALYMSTYTLYILHSKEECSLISTGDCRQCKDGIVGVQYFLLAAGLDHVTLEHDAWCILTYPAPLSKDK